MHDCVTDSSIIMLSNIQIIGHYSPPPACFPASDSKAAISHLKELSHRFRIRGLS